MPEITISRSRPALGALLRAGCKVFCGGGLAAAALNVAPGPISGKQRLLGFLKAATRAQLPPTPPRGEAPLRKKASSRDQLLPALQST